MPRIVSSGSQNASIEAIKKYFCSEYAVKLVAQQTGIAYEELIGGQYKLFLEPIAYFKHNGIMMAMTAHEAALYDNQAGGSLRKTMTSLTHKNLPLAMFLEYADMGFPAYTGATNKTCSNDTIITYLGMGIVWFTDPPEQPEPTDYDYEYIDGSGQSYEGIIFTDGVTEVVNTSRSALCCSAVFTHHDTRLTRQRKSSLYGSMVAGSIVLKAKSLHLPKDAFSADFLINDLERSNLY